MPTHAPLPRPVRWCVVVPLKGLRDAKSRLAPVGDDLRRELALAMAADTVAACADVVGARDVWVVTGDPTIEAHLSPLGVRFTDDPGTGLDAAVHAGEERARVTAARDGRTVGVAVVVGDLACLTAADLTAVLAQAAGSARGYVPDAEGTGTVVLTASPGTSLAPSFGPGSAARHGLDATRLDAPDRVRLDVDDADAWRRALALGVGPRAGRVVLPG